MTPQTKAWLIVICTALFTGGTASLAAISGGCKTAYAVASGIVAGAGAVLHALMQSPNQQPTPPQNEAVIKDSLTTQQPKN